MEPDEIKSLINEQGKAFEAFKATMNELKKSDVVTEEKLARIEKSLDDAVEAKAKLDARFEAERKEREDLELRLSRAGKSGEAAGADEVKAANAMFGALAHERKEAFTPLNADQIAAYKSAHERYMRKGENALSDAERKALSVGVDADGGYFVLPDTSGRIVTRVYESSPIRQIASVQTISTDKLEGIEDLGEASVGYAEERALSGVEGTPQVGKWSIPVYWIDCEPKATQQILDDSVVDLEAWLAQKVSDKFARFESAEFVNGATRIRGLTSYEMVDDDGSGVAWGKIGRTKSGANGAFASTNPADAIFDLIGLVKNEYLNGARFLTRRKVITQMRKFKDTTGQYLWQPSLVAGNPETFAGYAITRAEDMPDLATGSVSLMFGNFATAYQIVDRQGARVIRDNLTSKPWVKFYTSRRVGGGMVNFEAVKAMRFAA